MKKLLFTLASVLILLITNDLIAQSDNPLPDYPWLADLVSTNTCTTEKVEVYDGFIYSYLLVTDANGVETMYNTEGQFYCQNAPNYDCIAAYRLNGPSLTWECGSADCTSEDPFSITALAAVVNANPNPSTCVYAAEISQFDYQGATYYKVKEEARNASECSIFDYGSYFVDCRGAVVGGFRPNYWNCQATTLCDNLLAASNNASVIWRREQEDNCTNEDPFSLSAIQTAINTPPRLKADGSACWYIKLINEFQFEGKTFYRIVEDANPDQQCVVEWGTRFYTCDGELIGGTGNYPLCDDAAVCVYDVPTLIEAVNASGNIIWESEIGQDELNPMFEVYPWLLELVNPTNCNSEKVELYTGNAQHPYSYLLVTAADGSTKLYNTSGTVYCEQTTPGQCIAPYVAAYGLSSTPHNTWECASTNPVPPLECPITITNNECRVVGIYDEADNFLTAMGSADPGPFPFRPSETWTDTRLLAANETRIYIFKDGNLEIGRDTVTCDNPNINVISKYFSGCTDAVGISQLTNVGCQVLNVFDTRGNLLQSATRGESISLSVLDRIYVVVSGADTLQIGTFVGGDIDTKGCSESSPCLVAITNNECRRVGVHDEEDNLLVTMASAPIPNSPLSRTPQRWIDARPLTQGETRTYIFKENNFILGRQTVTCTNTEITVVSNQFNACTDAIFSTELTNTGCRVIQVYNTSGGLINTASPNETFLLESNREIYILLAGMDTLSVNSDRTVDSGGCGEESNSNNQIFEDYAWLNDLGASFFCAIREVEVWRSGIFTFLLVTDNNGSEILYNENGQFYCQNSSNYDCISAFNLNELVETWTCASSPGVECLVTITNNECRFLRIYDENGVLLNINQETGRPSAIRPDEAWEDMRPLVGGETRTYIFRDGDLELGRQIATCANPNIDLVNRYDDGCQTPYEPSELTNVGCTLLRVFHSGGGLIGSAFPGETLSIESTGVGQYLIAMANQDTLGVEIAYGVRDIDTGGCPDTYNYNNVQVFEDYPWLTGIVDRDNCAGERVEVWEARTTTYVWVEDENGNGTLYTTSGQVQCRPAPSFPINCFSAYELRDVLAVWTCGATSSEPNCENNTGTFFFENCDDGVLFFFLRTDDGRVYDPYFDAGITFNPIDGQRINFDFVDASFPSPCSVAEKAIVLTCIEEIEGNPEEESEMPNDNTIFNQFSWLSEIVDPSACNGEMITVYQIGSFQFIYIVSSSGSSLYFQDGTFYCSDLPNYDCRAVYGLSRVQATWRCSNFDLPASEERNKELFPTTDFAVFPNPTNGQLHIQFTNEQSISQQLRILDMFGREVYTQNVTLSTITVDLTNYQNGVYYLEFSSLGQRVIRKVVKQGLN